MKPYQFFLLSTAFYTSAALWPWVDHHDRALNAVLFGIGFGISLKQTLDGLFPRRKP